jgi:hypothetical protein
MPLPNNKNALQDLISEIETCEQSIDLEVQRNRYSKFLSHLNMSHISVLLLAWIISPIGLIGCYYFLKYVDYMKDTEAAGAAIAGFILTVLAGPGCLTYLAATHLNRYSIDQLAISKHQTLSLIAKLQAMGELTTFNTNSTLQALFIEMHDIKKLLAAKLKNLSYLEYAKQNVSSGEYIRKQVLFHRNATQGLASQDDDIFIFPKGYMVIEEENNDNDNSNFADTTQPKYPEYSI